MFILRRVTSEGLISNQIIGNEYNLLFDDRSAAASGEEGGTTVNYKNYQKFLENYTSDEVDKIHMVVFWDYGGQWVPIYKKSTYYIMTESGKTFDTIKRWS